MIVVVYHGNGLWVGLRLSWVHTLRYMIALQNVLPLIPDESRGLMQRIILAAYEHPRFSSEKHQQREITEFQNSVFLSCMDAD